MRSLIGVALSIALGLAVVPLRATPIQQQEFFDPTADLSAFGYSIAVNEANSKLLVGAPFGSQGGLPRQLQGDVFAFAKVAGVWGAPKELVASDAAPCSSFGFSVAVSGNTAAIGSPAWSGGCPGQAIGKVYIFTNTNGAWVESAILMASDASVYDRFGYSVAISGSTVVIGAPHVSDPGAAYVFVKNVAGNWVQQQKLLSNTSSSGDMFGYSVAIAADKLAVTQTHVYGGTGAVNLFANSGGVWNETQSFAGTAIGDGFGFCVAMTPTTVVVGAPAADVGGQANRGAVNVYRYANNAWSASQSITPNGTVAQDEFGYSLAINNGGLLVGAPIVTINGAMHQGAAYFFFDTGTVFSLGGRLLANDGAAEAFFGRSVALSNGFSSGTTPPTSYFVGASGAQVNEHGGTGAAYLFSE
jgi:hypothetical protein